MKKHEPKKPLSGRDLEKLYPKALTYDEKAKLDQQTANRLDSSRPNYPAFRVSLSISGVVAFRIASIRLGSLSFGMNPITGVSLSVLFFLASIVVLALAYGYANRLFGYQNRSAGSFFAVYALSFFIAWGIAGYLIQADFIKLAFSSLQIISLVLLCNTAVVYLLSGLFIGYRR